MNEDFKLDARDFDLLSAAQRLLVKLDDAKLATRVATRTGYNDAAHAEGWRFYDRAAGRGRPLPLRLVIAREQQPSAEDPALDRLRELDGFENKWLPRTSTAIDRALPAAQRADAVAAFGGLQQKPFGPEVVDSVKSWLVGYDACVKNDPPVPGGARILELLREKLLTTAAVDAVRDTLKKVEAGGAFVPTAADAARAASNADQAAALAELKTWYADWATTFRDELGYHDLLKLGLREQPKRKSTPDDAGDAGDAADSDATTAVEAADDSGSGRASS